MSTPRFKPYPAYKDSGVEWLGEIPAHWDVKPLKHMTAFTTGWTPPTGRDDFYGGEHLWANISDLGPNVLLTTEKTISDAAIREARLQKVAAGSLLFSFKLSVGMVSLAGTDMYTNEAIAAFAPSSKIDTHYLYWAAPVLVPHNAQENIYGAPLLSSERIENARLVAPPIREQRAIAAFLDRETARIDALVTRKERLIELLQEKRTALITRAVTKGLDPTVPLKDPGVEWLGQIPAHWDAARMRRISRAVSGGTPARDERAYWDGEIPWVSPKDMKRRVIDSSEDTVTETAIRETGIRLLEPPMVLIVVRGMILAHSFPVGITSVPVTINQDMKALTFMRNIEPDYMAWVLEGIGSSLIGAVVEEAAHGTRAIRMDQWRAVPVPIPPSKEQRAIKEFVERETDKIDALVARIREANSRVTELRAALISAAVTGRIDLRGETP